MFGLLTLPERLRYVRIVSIKDYSDRLITKLQELGLIHIEELKKVPEEELRRLREQLHLLDMLNEALRYVEGFVSTPKLVEVRVDLSASGLERELFKAYSNLVNLKKGIEVIMSNINRLSEVRTRNELMLRYLESIPKGYRRLKLADLNYDGDLFFTRLVKVKAGLLNELMVRLKDIKVMFMAALGDELLLGVVGFRESLRSFNDIVSEAGHEIVDVPRVDAEVDEYIEKLKMELAVVEEKERELKLSIVKLIDGNLEAIALSKLIYEAYRERLEVLLNALLTDYCFIVEGWLPEASYVFLRGALYREFKYVLVEDVAIEGREPPTMLRNQGVYKSFELITRLYGIPRYDEWDPTRLIAYSFLVFFGLMLADVVYGAALVLITKYLLDRLGFVDNPYSESYLNLKRILMVLGGSSALFGLFSNTYAGYSIPKIQPLIDLSDPLKFIKLALIIGLFHVNLAHLLAVVRSVRTFDRRLLLIELGLLIAELAALPYILWYFLGVRLLPIAQDAYNYLLYLSFVGLVILVAGKYMELRSIGLFLWLFDVTGLLGDVFSYTRIAGIGLATYLMARSFNDLALITFNSLLSTVALPLVNVVLALIASLAIVLLANTINVAFGVIGSFVHSLRLCFVEFLPKFYEGGGREFKPLRIPTPRFVMVGKTA